MRTFVFAGVFAVTALAGCGPRHAPFAGQGAIAVKDAGATDDAFLVITPPPPPPADAGGLCGNQIIPLVVDRPNLYFVLDASGSMATPIAGAANRYAAAVTAIATLLKAVGHRVSYGAAIFPTPPGPSDAEGCTPGQEVFPTRPGDPVSFAIANKTGDVLNSLLRTLDGYSPNGSTPTAASLEALKSTLVGLPGKTYAFLLTDGAPNCDTAVACTAANCTVNIEGGCNEPAGVNCCDPALGVTDYGSCLDADPTVAAVADLATHGIATFIIGMPGTSAYASLLDRLAVAGVTARGSEPQYYPAEGATDLTATLEDIGLSVAISCNVPLNETPPDQGLVNVYFDQTIVPQNAANGWTWVSDSEIRLVGDFCDLLKGGAVLQVQVVAGCPTTTR